MKTLRIQDFAPEGYLCFDLADILQECVAYSDHRWVVVWVIWSSSLDRPEAELEHFKSFCLEELANEAGKQTVVTYHQLMKCAKSVIQTESGLFLAIRPDVKPIPELRTLRDCMQLSDLFIEAFDATFWEVTTHDEHVLNRLAGKFNKTEVHALPMEGSWRVGFMEV